MTLFDLLNDREIKKMRRNMDENIDLKALIENIEIILRGRNMNNVPGKAIHWFAAYVIPGTPAHYRLKKFLGVKKVENRIFTEVLKFSLAYLNWSRITNLTLIKIVETSCRRIKTNKVISLCIGYTKIGYKTLLFGLGFSKISYVRPCNIKLDKRMLHLVIGSFMADLRDISPINSYILSPITILPEKVLKKY